MSFRLPPAATDPERSDSESTSSDDEEETWDDWVSDSGVKPCQSLFDGHTFPSAAEAIAHDKSVHGFDLEELSKRLALDFHQRVRLINYIRKEKAAPSVVGVLSGTESFLKDDAYLKPVIEDDKLLEYDGGDWSDDNPELPPDQGSEVYRRQIADLSSRLALSNQALVEYKEMMGRVLGYEKHSSPRDEHPDTQASTPARDDDTHYFRSYSENEIHSIMIQDTVRTSTYATFILSNPQLFENAVVLDVGCGTGILSLFAASAGAAHVYAVDASEIVEKAKCIVRDNKMEDKITVIRGKVEDIKLPVEKVDVIISEWMGYALLYESMLDSVLHARDRFLSPGGLVAPTESRIQLALCDPTDVRKERIGFWEDIYGFDMSAMSSEVYEDAIIDIIAPEHVLSLPQVIKTINACNATAKQLDFSVPFTLTSTSSRKTKAHAFLLYFDIIFNTDPESVDPSFEVSLARPGEGKVAEVWPLGQRRGSLRRRTLSKATPPKEDESGKKLDELRSPQRVQPAGKVKSFTTSPMSIPTHWKQTVFLLREPIPLVEGTIVQGTFYCRKSSDNSRELDVEIHYASRHPDDETANSETVVQIYKVR